MKLQEKMKELLRKTETFYVQMKKYVELKNILPKEEDKTKK